MEQEKILEFYKVREQWSGLAVTQAAKEKIAQAEIFLDERELRKQLKDTTDAKQLLEKVGMPPLSSIDEAKEIVARAQKEGCLTPWELERVEKALTAVGRLKSYLGRGKLLENPLAYYEMDLKPEEELRQEIYTQIRNGEVDDHASRQLFEIRRDIGNMEEKMRQKAEQIIRSNKDAMADQFSTFRSGRLCVPVKKEYRWKIPGSAIDKSSTGNTIFVEPVSVSNLYEELQLLKLDEENEVHRILYTLTAMVADSAETMNENMRVIERLDFIFSKAKLSVDMDASEPRINMERRLILKDARHPLMDREVCVPLQFQVENGVSGVIITGPNTGGKTVSIKTVALNCLMAQTGLHVTCSDADICMNSSYLCDIGGGQDMTENLSTFSAHIKNALHIIREANAESLVIMDELGSGTDPTEGMGIAVAILEELRKSGCMFLVTTHYPEVKEYAEKSEGVMNARMEFDRETLRPTYRMIQGEAGESCAFYIAEKLGMPAGMLENAARAAYGKTVSLREFEMVPESTKISGKGKKIQKKKEKKSDRGLAEKFRVGDSVMVLPDKKTGIVCEAVNEKGVLRVQLPGKKIWINHKRVKLLVEAQQLYPEDYDLSIVFDTVENRKARHEMGRKYTEKTAVWEEA